MTELHDHLKLEIREANRRIVLAVDDLTDEELASQPGGTTPVIHFDLWHSAGSMASNTACSASSLRTSRISAVTWE